MGNLRRKFQNFRAKKTGGRMEIIIEKSMSIYFKTSIWAKEPHTNDGNS